MRGFSLIEVILVIGILSVLAALLMPAVYAAIAVADQTTCASNLHQLGLALGAYLAASDGEFFPLRTADPEGVAWYFGFEPADSLARGEGRRVLDRTRAKLFPYLKSYESVEVCPAFPYDGAYKPKYEGRWWTYGINYELCGHGASANIGSVLTQDAGRTAVFADAAQVNVFQAPASRTNPLIEEWFYIRPRLPYVHFRHRGRANVLFADWHVGAADPAPGSFNRFMPEAKIGWFDPDEVLLRPRGPR